jgi:ABC-2 type transport system permease protein
MTVTTDVSSAVREPRTEFVSVASAAIGIATRSVRNIRRRPSAVLPALMMPLFQVIAFSGTYAGITRIPGFPTDDTVNWYLPLAAVMGCSFAGIGVGFSTIVDLQSGFYDRIRMSPAPRLALLLGLLWSAWLRALIVIALVYAVGMALGARLTDGPLGIATLTVAGLGLATVSTGWGLGLAYRFRDMRAAAVMQLGLFIALFLTNAQTPVDLTDGWLHAVARVNPLTNVLRLSRVGFLGEITWDETWGGLVAIAGLSAVSAWFAWRGLNALDD